jgi:hypothetical protein
MCRMYVSCAAAAHAFARGRVGRVLIEVQHSKTPYTRCSTVHNMHSSLSVGPSLKGQPPPSPRVQSGYSIHIMILYAAAAAVATSSAAADAVVSAAIVVAAAAAITAAISCTLLRDTSTSCRTHPRAVSRATQPRALHRTLHRAPTRRTAPSRAVRPAAPGGRASSGARARLRRAVSCGACGGPSPAAPAAGRGVERSLRECAHL